MKVLWDSNAPWCATGYGQQSKVMCKALVEAGHDLTMFAFYGLQGGGIEYDGYPVLPNSGFDPWGNDVILQHVERVKSDVVITLMDLFVLDTQVWRKLSVPWIAWVPIDAEGIGAATRERLSACAPVAMSDFGVKQMQHYDIDVPARIYHAVDTDVFFPTERGEARERFGLPPDKYIVGMVMANKGDRKQYPVQLWAIKRWMDKNPDYDVQVFIHADPTARMGGWDIKELVDVVGLTGKVYSTNDYDSTVMGFDQPTMAQLYNSFDVLMNCSSGEGFGIPIIEAQACGVPVLTTNASAMPEITKYGYTVEPQGKGLANHMGWMFPPSPDDMEYRLECVYRMANGTTERTMAAHAIQQEFAIPVITQQWMDVLGELQFEMDENRSTAREVFVP